MNNFDEAPRRLDPGHLALEERLGSDRAFDGVYDDARIRALSEQHWTPVAIAARAARLLTRAGATRILDIGSGAGKFCIAGALCTTAAFVGIERREGLVRVARQAASRLGASNASFVHGNIDSFSFAGFDGFYLYNPFYEQIAAHLVSIDDDIERSYTAHAYYVRKTVDKLHTAAPRAVVVTFNGFGGAMPRGYQFMGDEPAGNDRLELWIKE